MDPIVDERKLTSKVRLEQRLISEAAATGFSHNDQQVSFYTQVSALLEPDHMVLDFGAGRGEWFEDEPVRYRRYIQNFRGRARFVDGCDVDPAVEQNPTLDRAMQVNPGDRLPYEDARFDLVVSRYVFEHLADPRWAASELARIAKPGGWLCALTVNKWGYVALASRLVPNRFHTSVLRRVQPHRKAIDVFPTFYRLNTPGDLERHFGAHFDLHYYRDSAVPSYHFGRPAIFRGLRFLHRILPGPLHTGLYVLMRRKPK